MGPRLISPSHAAALTAAFDALSAAHDGAGTGQPDWWQGIADAHQHLAGLLDAVANAMATALVTTGWDAPERALIEVVRRAAWTHREQAEVCQARQTENDTRTRRNQDRAYATYAGNITAAGVDTAGSGAAA